MSFLFGKPPEIPPPPKPPAVESPEEREARARQRAMLAAAKGRTGDVYTSPLGLASPVPAVNRKTLLGE